MNDEYVRTEVVKEFSISGDEKKLVSTVLCLCRSLVYTPLALTSKRRSWRTTSKFRRSTEQIIDGNSIVYMNIKCFTFYFIFINNSEHSDRL